MNLISPCPLCSQVDCSFVAINFKRTFFKCPTCDLVFVDPSQRLTEKEERTRYESHNNNVEDPRYQDFLRPLMEVICRNFPSGAKGLDFGAGPGPALAEMLKKMNYEISLYDPFFWPGTKPLQTQYDFVLSSEAVEHFFNPRKEFQRLRSLLKPQGALFIMTLLHSSAEELSQWYYLKDPTHVCAFSQETFYWIRKEFGFERVEFHGPRIISLFS
ncbi:MAG: class I SAM-dependent methyltransferase [Pseudomonadota bacterium]